MGAPLRVATQGQQGVLKGALPLVGKMWERGVASVPAPPHLGAFLRLKARHKQRVGPLQKNQLLAPWLPREPRNVLSGVAKEP